ncbi:MAG: sigma-70 family RNA polymerase sigma factor [Proteobacteria bacterium]|nr:sigma-70 family RNA polymerase sigma factor [Pseudomonadota bacterium]
MSEARSALDADDVARARAGDMAAFAALVRRHQDRVFRFVLRMLDARDEATELTQDVFVKAWQALPGWRPEASFSTWLLQIARNAALDQLRRRQLVRFAPLEDGMDVADAAPGPEASYAGRQQQAQLDRALRRIAAEHREILLLREVEGLAYGELARVLGIAEGTVKSRLARARAALLEHFHPHAGVTHE